MSESRAADATITIPAADAQVIRAALNSAYHQNTVLDLADQYRKLTLRPQDSKLTHGLRDALTLLSHYVELAESEEEVDDQPDS